MVQPVPRDRFISLAVEGASVDLDAIDLDDALLALAGHGQERYREVAVAGDHDGSVAERAPKRRRRRQHAGLPKNLEAALRPGGFVVLGKAERPTGASLLVNVAPCIYRRERG